jgi:hypothetical protein
VYVGYTGKAILAQKRLVGLRVAALTKTSQYNLDRENKERERREEKRREEKRREEREINHYGSMKPGQRKSDIIW